MRKYFILLVQIIVTKLRFAGKYKDTSAWNREHYVPANVLILLDASGSMGWNTTVGKL